MNWMTFQEFLFNPTGYWGWSVRLFLVLLLTASVVFIWRRLHRRIGLGVSKSQNKWDDILWKALGDPVAWGIWLIGISVAVTIVRGDLAPHWLTTFGHLRDATVVVLIAWFAIRVVQGLENHWLSASERGQDSRIDATTAHAIGKLLRATVLITAGIMLLQSFNINVSAVLAFGGLGGLAVGMAAKDLLANFFGGLTVYLDRPFQVGDWIRSPDRQIEGTVEYIGWRHTRIRTFDKRPLYVPNATFSQIAVENPSRMTHRRIYETIGLRYQDARQVRAIVTAVKDYLAQHEDLDTTQTIIVNFNRFSESSLDFFIYCFTKTTDWVTYHKVKERVLLDILDIIHAHGADVAFPTRTLYLENNKTG